MKRVLCPKQLRKIPQQFSWIDHRLVRDGYTTRCSAEALCLYLFLVTVGDAQGLSYYSDKALGLCLPLTGQQLLAARKELERASLIAYRHPLYQVLSLEPKPLSYVAENRRGSELKNIAAILRHALEGR